MTGSLIRRVIDGVNRLAGNVGAAAMGETSAPDPVDSITVQGTLDQSTNILTVGDSGTNPTEILHAVHTHNAPLSRGIQYITEVDTDPNFSNPHPLDGGCSRSVFAHLPTKDSNGATVGYYLRVTPQYPGSSPGKPTIYGGPNGPTKIVFTGTTKMTLLSPQAAGTAKPGQTGQGLGKFQARPAVGGPKRNLSNQ